MTESLKEAKRQHEMKVEAIENQLEILKNQLRRHQETIVNNRIDWSHVGSLGRLNADLADIIAYMN